MPFKPFPYQQECLANLAKARRHHQRSGLVVMASGLGKTVTAGLDAKRFLDTHGGRLLYLCHQNDILHQARTTFEAILGNSYTYGFYHGLSKTAGRVDCLFASFQTMHHVREEFRRTEFDYIVVDESHHGPAPTYQPTIKYFRPKFLLGLTATPERTDLQDIVQSYGETVFSLPLEEALARGFLSTVDYRLMTDELRDLDVLDTPVGKMSVTLLNKKLFIPRRDEEIARLIRLYAAEQQNPRVMVFCPSIDYTTRLAAHLPDSMPIHSHLSDRDQRNRLDLFRQGVVNTVLTVDKFNEGIDVPDANVVVFLRSTASRIVFYQQLGRGLRKAPDKKKVMVLDFVANCERLEMINSLWTDIERRRNPDPAPRPPVDPMPPISVDIGKVEFTEVAKRVLDVLAAIRGGYNREMLISLLQKLAKRLGHKPSRNDVVKASKAGTCASAKMYEKTFGTFNNAIIAAGFDPLRRGTAEEIMLDELRAIVAELGHTPSYNEVNMAHKLGKCTSTATYIRRFGSLRDALNLVGSPMKNWHAYGKEELIRQLQALAKNLGRSPSIQDVSVARKRGECAHLGTFNINFGSHTAALRAAGLTPSHGVSYSNAELIEQLRAMAKKLGRVPNTTDVQKQYRSTRTGAGVAVYTKRFGSFAAALQAAGLKDPKRIERRLVLNQLKRLIDSLGRRPSKDEVAAAQRAKTIPSNRIILKHFHTLGVALTDAGAPPSYRARRYSVEELKDVLRRYAKTLGHTPSVTDLIALRTSTEGPSINAFRGAFGSMVKAFAAAGLAPSVALARRQVTRDLLITQLRTLTQHLGHAPSSTEINEGSRAGRCASLSTFIKEFGGIPLARAAANLPTFQSRGSTHKLPKEEIVKQLRRLWRKIGRVPEWEDIRQASIRKEIVSTGTLRDRFGTVHAALVAAKILPS